jgi:hypothetical protein
MMELMVKGVSIATQLGADLTFKKSSKALSNYRY